MQPVCQLEKFDLTRLHVDWIDPGQNSEGMSKTSVTYDVLQHNKDPQRYVLIMRVEVEPTPPTLCGHEIHATIRGEFLVSQDPSGKTNPDLLVRLNGLNILYGILRGQVAQVTGSFPWGKLILPSMMMQDVIAQVEGARLEAKKKEWKTIEVNGGLAAGNKSGAPTKRVRRIKDA